MSDITGVGGRLNRVIGALAAAAVVVGMSVASPATAQPIEEPSNDREVVVVDPELDPARVATGDGVSPVASASAFDPGYLISDYAMFNRAAMTQAEIQSFLDARIGSCSNGKCLNVLSVPTSSQVADPMCRAYQGAASESIARIIYKVQVACGVSAKAILVTLQKEQGLATNTAPSDTQLRKAMGYACPDTAACDPGFAGIADQLYWGARAFVRYTMPEGTGPGTPFYTNFNWFPVGTPMQIQYHPNTACGTKTVTIRNKATSSLYFYTPYTPNAAALTNLYGTGNSCSTYGNRNFWRLYTDWFGSPTTLVPSGVETVRVDGRDRYATAAAVSLDTYPEGASTVFVAAGNNFADGLAAAPAAAVADAPLLLVGPTTVPAATATELQRLNPAAIVIVGGAGVVGEVVAERMKELVPAATVARYFGTDRYETAASVALNTFGAGGASTVYLATGDGYADALAASAAAGSMAAPVLLVSSSDTALSLELSTLIEETLGATRIIIAGGTGVVSSGVQQSAAGIPGVTEVVRLGGADRYATAAALNDFAFDDAQDAFIVSGRDYPDALSAAAAAGAMNAPLHLSNGTCTFTPSLQHLVDSGVQRVAFVGGTGVIRSSVTEFLTCG